MYICDCIQEPVDIIFNAAPIHLLPLLLLPDRLSNCPPQCSVVCRKQAAFRVEFQGFKLKRYSFTVDSLGLVWARPWHIILMSPPRDIQPLMLLLSPCDVEPPKHRVRRRILCVVEIRSSWVWARLRFHCTSVDVSLHVIPWMDG